MHRDHPHKASCAAAIAIAVALPLAVGNGCQSFDLRRRIPWKTSHQLRTEVPIKIVATWSDAVRHRPEGRPVRGFGGRVYFYGKEEDKPVAVEGTIVVYAFDESGRAPSNAVPDRKYVFPPDQVARLHSETSLGHSYSLWLPWGEVGGPRKEISMIVRFQPVGGRVVVGGQTTCVLPGTGPPAGAAAAGRELSPRPHGTSGAVRRAGFEKPEEPDGAASNTRLPARERMSTTTISIGERRGRPLPSIRQRALRRLRRDEEAPSRVEGHPPSPPASAPSASSAEGPPGRNGGGVPIHALERWQRPARSTIAAPRPPIRPVARPAFGRPRWPQALREATRETAAPAPVAEP